MKMYKRQSGFTIAEILISVSVFIILTIVATGAFINGLRSQRSLTEIMSMNNNLGIVLEQMVREFRTGYFNSAPGDGGEAEAPFPNVCNSTLRFINGQNTQSRGGISLTQYSLSNGRIRRTVGSDSGFLTSENVSIENLCFLVQWEDGGVGESYCNPPRLTIQMQVKTNSEEDDVPPRFIQTTVSSRVLPRDIESDPFGCKTL